MKWTSEQLQAINQRGTNIIVSAGAGSGKTAVLSERVLAMVQSGIDIRRILILTFTNEAAGEMANRIRKKLKKAGLSKALRDLNEAYITTFDAYALSVVKKYHYLLNISRDVKIVDSSVIALEKEKILDEIFMDLYEEKNEAFLKLLDDFTLRDDDLIKEAVLSINGGLDLKYDKDKYLDKYLEKFYSKEYVEKRFDEFFSLLKEKCLELENTFYELEGELEPDFSMKLYDVLGKFFQPKTYDDLYKYKDSKLPRFCSIDEEYLDLKERIKALFSEIKSYLVYSKEEYITYYMSTYEYVQIIREIIKRFDIKINLYKKERCAYEFTDIAKMAIRIVSENESICESIKNYFVEIMIDEYQDTSDLQEVFINYIENNNVYMVGDIKQSIYRFRNANPDIFRQKYNNYSNSIGGEKIDLLKNFRSREEVLHNINEIFAPIMQEDMGGADYKHGHMMVYGNKAYETLGKNDNNNYMNILKYESSTKEFTNDEIEAFIIAQDIKKKMEEKYLVYDADKEQNREITYNDFSIILDRGSAMDLYKKIFEYFNIPLDMYKDSDLLDDDSIYILKNIIGLVQKIYLGKIDKEMRYFFMSVARSYLGNMMDDEVFSALESNDIYKTDVYLKCKKLAQDLDKKSPYILLREIYETFDVYKKLTLVGNVEAGLKRYRYLWDLAQNMDDLGYTINDFKNYLDKQIKENKSIKYKTARSIEASVKLMNIHKSKGLEFPVCYFAGFAKAFNLRDLHNKFMFDNTYGIITPFYDDGVGDTFIKYLVKRKYYSDEIAEKIRLFYVALTRSKEKIIMVMPEVKKPRLVKDVIDAGTFYSYRSFYDFLSSLSGNLKSYQTLLNMKDLNLTKDYNFIKSKVKIDVDSKEKIEFINIDVEKNVQEMKRASHAMKEVITKEENKLLEYGTSMHEKMEYSPLDDKVFDGLAKYFDFDAAKVLREHEFYYEINDVSYHGIIDLLLIYDDKVVIIDYKLKDISKDIYKEQLQVYYDYVASIYTKKIEVYLYSIIGKRLEKVFD